MYGVPADLDLAMFDQALLVSINLGEFMLGFNFQEPAGPGQSGSGPSLAVEGKWELRDKVGALVDQSMPASDRDVYRVHLILGHSVAGTDVDSPRSLALQFDNGFELRVFDDSPQYESFQIQPGDVIV